MKPLNLFKRDPPGHAIETNQMRLQTEFEKIVLLGIFVNLCSGVSGI